VERERYGSSTNCPPGGSGSMRQLEGEQATKKKKTKKSAARALRNRGANWPKIGRKYVTWGGLQVSEGRKSAKKSRRNEDDTSFRFKNLVPGEESINPVKGSKKGPSKKKKPNGDYGIDKASRPR